MSKEGMSGKGRVSTKPIQTTIPWAIANWLGPHHPSTVAMCKIGQQQTSEGFQKISKLPDGCCPPLVLDYRDPEKVLEWRTWV